MYLALIIQKSNETTDIKPYNVGWVLQWGEKTRAPREKPLKADLKTNKLNPLMMLSLLSPLRHLF